MELGKNLNTISDFTKNVFEKHDIPFPVLLAERHPHIVNNIALFWGYKDFPDYVDRLFLNEQTKDRVHRQGFLPDVFLEIIELTNLHNSRYPQFQNNSFNDPYGI